MNSNSFLPAAEIPWEPAGEGVRRQIMGYNDHLMLVKVEFTRGAIGAAHAHDEHTQSSYVASGKFEVTIDGEQRILQAGDGFFAAPRAMHGVVCLEAGILIDAFNPLRSDFLKK